MLKYERETQCFIRPEPTGPADWANDYRKKPRADDTDHGACRSSQQARYVCRPLARGSAIVCRFGPGLGTTAGQYEDAAIWRRDAVQSRAVPGNKVGK